MFEDFDFYQENKMSFQRKLIVVALASAMPLASAYAQTAGDLQKEIASLKAQLQSLQQKVEAMGNQSQPAVSPQQVNRIEQKLELMEADAEKSGFSGLSIKGQIDPTLIYNRNADTADAVFMNNNSAGFGYDNSSFGQAMVEVTKLTEDGTKLVLRLTPKMNSSLVHEATVAVPLGDDVMLNAGLTPDYSGYELAFGSDNPLITHNLLFDFTAATNYVGVGTTHTVGPFIGKWMVGNVDSNGGNAPGLAYRGDWSMSEYSGIGFSGVHGTKARVANAIPAAGFTGGDKFNLMEIDGYYTRGDLTLQGQVSWGSLGNGASGANASWSGLSGLVGYKLTPRLQAILRADYIENAKNGGGVYGTTAGDTRNGFGSSWEDDGTGTNTWVQPDTTKGVNRMALSAGLNYLLNEKSNLKLVMRVDSANGNVFYDQSNGKYVKDNFLLGTAVVVKF
jgi:hypothetical protein